MFVPNLQEVEQVIDARRARMRSPSAGAAADFTNPLAIGLLLTFLPPVAVALVWQSPHFNRAARVAVTAYGLFAFAAMLAAFVFAVHG